MLNMQNHQPLTVSAPSLPKGGGSLQGMGETLTLGGPTGASTLSIPLPITTGRGTAPTLALTYSSLTGTGPFGRGWQVGTPAFRVRTALGTPHYTSQDTYLSPDGEILRIALNEQGEDDTRITRSLQGVTLPASWRVTRYQPRIVQDFSRFEFWQPDTGNTESPFWVAFSSDGEVSLWGKTPQARTANPENPQQIAEWLPEESVTATGEHITWQYRTENDAQCDETETSQHPQSTAQRYLSQVNYGNITPQASLFALDDTPQPDTAWLFHLVFDYGERGISPDTPPAFSATSPDNWLLRPDCHSRFDYGFEVRTRRLCRQVLMYHRLEALVGHDVTNEVPALVSRLMLTYALNNDGALLTDIRQMAYDEQQTLHTLPPLSLTYQPAEKGGRSGWQPIPVLEKYNLQQPYQFVDLYGEGLPGILYQDTPGAWWYRAPQRDTTTDDINAVTYDALTKLPVIPALQQSARLLDLNGDGRLDWLITAAGVNGHHTLSPDGQWSPFIPLSALPLEYFHPQSQLADITGDGLPDLIMTGPRSVRLYASQDAKWLAGKTVTQDEQIRLPLPGVDDRTLVAFADMLGSGQQHLVEIAATGVRCWPNLGHGRFGAPVSLPGFSLPAGDFDPDRIWLADTDGSGTLDILYAHRKDLSLYINESGNRFASPVTIALPDHVTFDRTCQLQVADTQGLGTPSLILTVPHMTPAHWHLALENSTPALLHTTDNHRGAKNSMVYRSSAQFWLDEKQRAQEAGVQAICYLPISMPLVWQRVAEDEITGNRLVSVQTYAHGAWDGKEREFRGFARVEVTDTNEEAQGVGNALPASPSRQVSWYATGMDVVDTLLADEFWQGDAQAWPHFVSRFTQYDSQQQNDVPLTLTDGNRDELHRALKGHLLRTEVYGEDGTPVAGIPYTVSEQRIQVRWLTNVTTGAAWVSIIEGRNSHYERVASDPQCHHQITLGNDVWGNPTDVVNIDYPRRPQPASSPYPSTLPDSLFASSYDGQQQILRLTRQRQTWYNRVDDESRFLPGLPLVTRGDVWEYAASLLPPQGLSREMLEDENGLLAAGTPYQYQGHQTRHWMGGNDTPSWPPLQTHTEQAILDVQALAAFDGMMQTSELEATLKKAGYSRMTAPLPLSQEPDVWVIQHGYTDFGNARQFWRPLQQQETLLTGKTAITWDMHYCVVTDIRDAAGATIHAGYDYRFLMPHHIIDACDNHQLATFDVWGRLTSTRFWGTENGARLGYTSPAEEKTPFTVPETVEAGLSLSTALPVAQCLVYCDDSWMTEEPSRLPPHLLVITTDRYDTDAGQQRRQSLTFSDGFGRVLQAAVRYPAGDAWQRAEDGSLVTGEDGKPATADSETRWAVSGRSEYDGKGQLIRHYQPYFLNSWCYLNDDSARQDLYADTHCYDAIGREYQVITARGDIRRTYVTPWFTVAEDENDTASGQSV